MNSRLLSSALLAAYFFLCLLLGGASAAGLWANVLLQLLALPFLLASILVRPDPPPGRAARQLVILLLLMAAVVLVQLVPLPPSVWTALPGRDFVREGFELVGEPLPWLPISLAPHDTIASALWLLPAVAVGLAVLRFRVGPAWIGWTIVLAASLSVLVGALQITGGVESPWYFYEITNYGVNVGLFANANHMATLLLATVPFLAALYMTARGRGRERNRQRSAGLFVILAGLFGLLLVGLAINGSLAGLGLLLPVSGATLLLLLGQRTLPGWAVGLVLLLTAASIGAAFSGRFDNNLISDEAQMSAGSRYTAFRTSLEAAGDHFPVGSGLGTFRPIYRLYEDPTRVTTTYMNHAHSDWIELILETGLPGALVLLAFLFWWVGRALAIWTAREPDFFARAATVASAAILAHSLVDYPLRTAAIAAVFAACCALMARGRTAPARAARSEAAKRPPRHRTAD